MQKPLMAKATAVWLVDNTTLSFQQIADFCGLHELEVQGIADGDVAAGVKGFDPVGSNQLDPAEIDKAQADTAYRMKLKHNPAAEGEEKRRGPRYTPLSKRQDRPAAILWLVKFHPELTDAQIAKLVGTTKPTIATIRDRTHWNMQNIVPTDPVALGLSKQVELDAEVQKAARKRSSEVMTDDERRKLVSTETSLSMTDEPRLPSSIAGLENFTLAPRATGGRPAEDFSNAESFFRTRPDEDAEANETETDLDLDEVDPVGLDAVAADGVNEDVDADIEDGVASHDDEGAAMDGDAGANAATDLNDDVHELDGDSDIDMDDADEGDLDDDDDDDDEAGSGEQVPGRR